jgi:hypothetical protein
VQVRDFTKLWILPLHKRRVCTNTATRKPKPSSRFLFFAGGIPQLQAQVTFSIRGAVTDQQGCQSSALWGWHSPTGPGPKRNPSRIQEEDLQLSDDQRGEGLEVWLGGLDSNQDSQIQNLKSCQLDDLPSGLLCCS